MKSRHFSVFGQTLSILLLIILTSCTSMEGQGGTFVTEGTADMPKMLIELKGDGSGVWRKAKQRTPFRWEVKGKQIRMHLKDGGVVVGERINNSITVDLPSIGRFTFNQEEI